MIQEISKSKNGQVDFKDFERVLMDDVESVEPSNRESTKAKAK